MKTTAARPPAGHTHSMVTVMMVMMVMMMMMMTVWRAVGEDHSLPGHLPDTHTAPVTPSR